MKVTPQVPALPGMYPMGFRPIPCTCAECGKPVEGTREDQDAGTIMHPECRAAGEARITAATLAR